MFLFTSDVGRQKLGHDCSADDMFQITAGTRCMTYKHTVRHSSRHGHAPAQKIYRFKFVSVNAAPDIFSLHTFLLGRKARKIIQRNVLVTRPLRMHAAIDFNLKIIDDSQERLQSISDFAVLKSEYGSEAAPCAADQFTFQLCAM